MKKKCRQSDKTKFDSFEIAWKRAGEILEKNNKTKCLSAYRCKFCNKIHLTGKEYREYENDKRKCYGIHNF
jgi:hypothetical protein